MFPANAAVDVHIQGNEHSMRHSVLEGLHSERFVFMIKECYGLSDQRDGGLIEFAAEGDRPVPVHFPARVDAEVIVEILRRLSNQMGVLEIPVEGSLPRAAVDCRMILFVKPFCKGIIELSKRKRCGTSWQKLHSYRPEEPLDLSLPLRLIGLGMNQGDAQCRRGMTQQVRSEGGSVVHVQLPGKTPFRQGNPQGGNISFHPFVQIKPGMRDQTAHIVDKGKQVGFAGFAFHQDLRAVHTVGLPDVVGQLRLEPPAVFRNLLPLQQSPLPEQTVDRDRMRFDIWSEDFPQSGLPHDDGHGSAPELLPEFHQRQNRLLVENPRSAPVFPDFGIKTLQSPAALLVPPDPGKDRRGADKTPLGIRDLPDAGSLLLQEPFALPPLQLPIADQIVDDTKPELGHPTFRFFVHGNNLLLDFEPPYQRRHNEIAAKTRWGARHKNNGSKCSEVLPKRKAFKWNKVGLITLACREAHTRKQRYQYCWFCRTTEECQRFSSVLLHRHLETTSAEYLSPFRKSRGRQVWTAEQSGHRKRFINSASRYPSKYLVTNPWPHKRLPKHDGHLSGLGQGYALPRVNISFTTTGKCSIKKPLLGRVIKVGELDNSAVMTLFLSCQINTILSSIYTKHRDKKIPLANSLLRRVTLWERLLKLSRRHDIEWVWVRGHAGHSENERCDALARNAIKSVISRGIYCP